MSKKLYVYNYIDRCDPTSNAYHKEGGLLVVTSGYPNDAVPLGTGNFFEITNGGVTEEKYGLPEPDHVFIVPDDSPDLVLPFPDAGCC